MFLVESRITGRRLVAREMFVIAMRAPEIAASVLAGQFVNIGWSPGPLLRRPFSVYRVDGERIEVVLKPVGVGTAQLLAMETRRPRQLPRPARVRDSSSSVAGGSVVLVSGGLGVAPDDARRAEAAACRDARDLGPRRAERRRPVLGVATAMTAVWATDDGSQGCEGHRCARRRRTPTSCSPAGRTGCSRRSRSAGRKRRSRSRPTWAAAPASASGARCR